MSSLDYLDLCRLCLVKDRVGISIFEDDGDVRQVFLKIASCLPVKVSREDKLPKKICDDCMYKLELFYQFWNTTANAEKQLLQWLDDVDMQDKQGYVTEVLNSSIMKQEQQASENRLDESVMQVSHQNNMGMGMMDNMGLGMPIIISTTNQPMTSVPMDTSGSSVQTIQAVPGTSTQSTHDQISQNQSANVGHHEVDEDSDEDEENESDDECDADDGLPVKEENEEDPNNRTVEPTTFVNVSLPCDEAGPSGLQQQKITEMPEMAMPQVASADNKTGYFVSKLDMLPPQNDECCDNINIVYTTTDVTGILITDDLKINSNGEILVTEAIYQCTHCGIIFVGEDELKLHMKIAHDIHEEKIIADDDNEDDDILLEDNQLACNLCQEQFNDLLTLKKHQQQFHSNVKLYNCKNCDYSSPHRQNLISHQRRHNLEYKFHCEICGAGFYTRNTFLDHQLSHSKEKPFQCDICNATFRYRQGLRLHAKLHQPDYIPPQKKHHCSLCNKRFSRKQVLLVHMRTHGNMGPQNEYVCHICGKSLSSKTYLTVHVRKHTGEKPHVCDLCQKAFTSQNYLSVHRRTHTGERPHKCTQCDKSFTQRTTLVVHLRGHTGDRPYPCSYCEKSFASKTMLNSHLKTHAKQSARQQQTPQQESEFILEAVQTILP
ncbi:zinc finger protein 623-like isoform X16 [Leptopilina heterotoma]|uniref:zinc finger protein 623-like isoform X16 n=1 Tax=Leptopilina heterotoma TaxID=63436 RepID=UPI001CA9F7A8|nr:zinc finger protein 623-like isoform X16 [Leptopilina heterotoma]